MRETSPDPYCTHPNGSAVAIMKFNRRFDHDDPVLDDNLRRRLMEEGWPTNTVFGEIRDISEYDETS